MEFDITYYLYCKIIETCMFDDDIAKVLKEEKLDIYLFNMDFLNVLEIFIQHAILEQCIESRERENLFTLLDYLRYHAQFEHAETKHDFWTRINQMIQTLNQIDMQKVNSENYYLKQMSKRIYKYNVLKKKIKQEEYLEQKEIVRKSIAYDYLVLLFNLTEEVEDPLFLEMFGHDFYYFMSVNALLGEQNYLVSSQEFMNSIFKMCNYYKEHKKEVIDSNKVLKHSFIYGMLKRS